MYREKKFQILCVTSRRLCRGSFPEQIRRVARSGVDGIILREKDLTEEEYASMAKEVSKICMQEQVPCIYHHFTETAKEQKAGYLQLSMPDFRRNFRLKEAFPCLKKMGVSIHSLEEAKEAESMGADYLVAGHIFQTDCKRGLPGRGTGFLKEICKEVKIPVYGIGGITPENVSLIRESGAKGACIMSGFMKESFCPPQDYLSAVACMKTQACVKIETEKNMVENRQKEEQHGAGKETDRT